MFSHIVTAAKGLFTRQDTDKAQSKNSTIASSDNTKMVTTRRRKISDIVPEEEPEINGQQEVNGKRKSGPASSGKTETQRNKRRKRASLEAAESESGTPEEPSEDTQETDFKQEDEKSAPAPQKHFRFDSEEPEVPLDMEIEETAETQQAKEDSGDDSSDDDEAPEAVDNSAQLSKVRAQAKKMEKAKQLSVIDLDFPPI